MGVNNPNQQLFLASGEQNNAQIKQSNARSITKIEKMNYNSVAQNAANRSKSNGR